MNRKIELAKLFRPYQEILDLKFENQKMIDCRGRNIPEGVVYEIASALAFKLAGKQKNFLISGDGRLDTPRIMHEFAEAMTDAGINVLDAGYGNVTPMFEIAREKLGISGVNITASHQAYEYNGLKLFIEPLPDEGKTEEFIREALSTKKENAEIFYVQDSLRKEYLDELDRKIGNVKFQGKILYDALQGTSFHFFDEIAKRKKIDFESFRTCPDAYFKMTSNGPDCSRDENFKILKDSLDLSRFSLIAIADGDGDRFAAATSHGLMSQPVLTALRAEFSGVKEFIAEYCLASIIEDYLKNKGIEVIHLKRGRTNIIPESKARKAPAAEMAGHHHGTDGIDDSIERCFDLIKIANQFENGGLAEKVSEISGGIRKFIPEIRVDAAGPSKAIVEELNGRYYQDNPHVKRDEKGKLADGIVIHTSEYGLFVRGSSNENSLTVNINNKDENKLVLGLQEVCCQLDDIEFGLGTKVWTKYEVRRKNDNSAGKC